jgi:hypothetical protein
VSGPAIAEIFNNMLLWLRLLSAFRLSFVLFCL